MRKLAGLLLLSLLITTGQGCTGGGSDVVPQQPVTLEYWRVFDDEDAFDKIITDYRTLHPNVTINYRKLRFDEYEAELLRALAEGRGPDIVSIHNTWLPGYQNLLMPMPSSVTVTSQETRGTIRKQTVTVQTEKPTMSLRTLKQAYVDQVAKDVVLDYQPDPKIDPVERIYGLPLSVDSLVLFYNKDLFNAAGISTPPQSWSEADFFAKVKSLTTYNSAGEIQQSAIAMGTADNIERSSDIISLLMMQVGTQMTDERGQITFQKMPAGSTSGVLPAINALQFYTDFANPTKDVYTWDKNFPNSFDAFASGKTAMFIGYSYHIPLLRTAAPKMNFGIAPIPQISEARQINYANYWVEAVAGSTNNPDWAWDFVLFATDEANVASYLKTANKPTAHRNLIATQAEDEDLGAFAQQTLTAESWYHGVEASVTEAAMKDLIDAVLSGQDAKDALDIAARKVSQTLK